MLPTVPWEETLLRPKENFLKEYHEVIDDLVSNLSTLDPVCDSVLITGTLVEGFGNSTSDLDVYVITSALAKQDREYLPQRLNDEWVVSRQAISPGYDVARLMMMSSVTSLKIDIYYYPESLLTTLNNYFQSQGEKEEILLGEMTENVFEFCHRLRIGIGVYNEDRLNQLKRSLDFVAFQTYMTQRYAREFQSRVVDVKGALDNEDYITAFINAREAMVRAVDAYLVCQGQTNTRCDKWRWRKLRRVHDREHPILQKYLELHMPGKLSNIGEFKNYVSECLDFGNRLVMPLAMSNYQPRIKAEPFF